MRETRVSLPFVVLIAATRGMLGVGIGLLLAGRLKRRHRERVGQALLAVGVASTVPLAIKLFGDRRTQINGERRAVPREGIMAH